MTGPHPPADQAVDPFARICAEARALPGGFAIDTPRHVIVHIPGRDRLLISFDNLSSERELHYRRPWGHPLALAHGWGSLGVMMKVKNWFRDPDLFDALETLRDRGHFSSYPAVSTYGSSMGGFGALAFGELFPGATAVAFAPQSSLAPDLAPFERRYRYGRGLGDWTLPRYRDAADGLAGLGRAYVIYDPTIEADRLHAQRLTGPNVILLPIGHASHKIPPMLNRMGILKPFATAALTGTLTPAEARRMLRARRRAVPWLVTMLAAAEARGHLRLALSGAERALIGKPHYKLRHLVRHLDAALAPPGE